jgi:hypothetical protein
MKPDIYLNYIQKKLPNDIQKMKLPNYIQEIKLPAELATAKSKTIKAIEHYGRIYYIPKSKKQMHIEKHYFLEWKNSYIELWKKENNLTIQKEMKALTIEDYRNEVKRVFQTYKEIYNNPILIKKLKEYWTNFWTEYWTADLNFQKLLKAMMTIDYRNGVMQAKKIIKNFPDLKKPMETFFHYRKKIEKFPDLKEKFKQRAKEFMIFLEKRIIANNGFLNLNKDAMKEASDILLKHYSQDSKIKKPKNKKNKQR